MFNISKRSFLPSTLSAVAFAAFGCAAEPEDDVDYDSVESEVILVTPAYKSLPEVSLLPPLGGVRATDGFDATLKPKLAVRTCTLVSNACEAPPVTIVAQNAFQLLSDRYVANWYTNRTVFPVGKKVRLMVDLAGLELASVDLGVSRDGTQLISDYTGGAIIPASKILPIEVKIGRSPQIAGHYLKVSGKTAVQIAQTLAASYGATADETADVLQNEGFSVAEVGSALKTAYNLTAAQAADILEGAGFNYTQIAQAWKTVYGYSSWSTAAGLKAAGASASKIADALKNVYGLAPNVTATVLKGINIGSILIANGLRVAYGLSAADTAAVLEGIGIDAYGVTLAMKLEYQQTATQTAKILDDLGFWEEMAVAMRDGFQLEAEGLGWVYKNIGKGVNEIAQAFDTAYGLAAEGCAGLLRDIGYPIDEVTQALQTVYDVVGTEAAKILRAIGIPPEVVVKTLTVVYHFAELDFVDALITLGVPYNEMIQWLSAGLGISTDAASALVCIAMPLMCDFD